MKFEERIIMAAHPRKLERTVMLMEHLIEKGKRDPRIRHLATKAIRKVDEGDYLGEVNNLVSYIKGRVRYTRDPHKIESVSDAFDTLNLGYGDCDDLAVCFGAFAEAIGHPTRLKIVGYNRPSHVYNEFFHKDQGWSPADLARPRHKVFELRSFPFMHTRNRQITKRLR